MKIVLLSLKTNKIVEKAASGPLNNASNAACGKYVKKNIDVNIPIPKVNVGTIFDINGCHNDLCDMK